MNILDLIEKVRDSVKATHLWIVVPHGPLSHGVHKLRVKEIKEEERATHITFEVER